MLDCHATRDALEEHRRGQLTAEALRAVEAHLGQCPACRQVREADDALVAALRTLPRPAAPVALRRRIRELGAPRRGPRAWLGRPWVAAAVAALVVAALLGSWVRLRGERAPDPVEALLRSGVAEHARLLLQLRGTPPGVPDPTAAFARVRALTDIELPRAFAGDDELTLVATRPTLLADRKAAAVMLRYQSEAATTYFAVPGKDLPMPAAGRVQIEQYKPYWQRVDRLNVIYWKQGELAWVMVSELDDARCRELFLRVRKAL